MEDKVPYITEQIDMWIRNWDIANIEYRLGVVRFRAKQGVNMVTVFKPPQTQEKIHSILKLPYSDDENLLQAILDGVQRIETTPKCQNTFHTYYGMNPEIQKQHIAGTIGYLKGTLYRCQRARCRRQFSTTGRIANRWCICQNTKRAQTKRPL